MPNTILFSRKRITPEMVDRDPRIHAVCAEITGQLPTQLSSTPITEGMVNEGFKITCGRSTFFVKANANSFGYHMFLSETIGLRAVGSTGCVRTPYVFTVMTPTFWYTMGMYSAGGVTYGGKVRM